MSESRNRTCRTCRFFTAEPDNSFWGVCWRHKDCFDGYDRYLSVHTKAPACDRWESVSSGQVGGEIVFVSSCDRDALLALADEMDHPIRQAVWNQTAGVRREHIMAEYARRIREACGEEVRNG